MPKPSALSARHHDLLICTAASAAYPCRVGTPPSPPATVCRLAPPSRSPPRHFWAGHSHRPAADQSSANKAGRPTTADDEFSKLPPGDQAKLALLEAEYERDGKIALKRLGESDPLLYLRLVGLFKLEAVRRAIEDAVIDAGLTNADIQAMLEKALRERKH